MGSFAYLWFFDKVASIWEIESSRTTSTSSIQSNRVLMFWGRKYQGAAEMVDMVTWDRSINSTTFILSCSNGTDDLKCLLGPQSVRVGVAPRGLVSNKNPLAPGMGVDRNPNLPADLKWPTFDGEFEGRVRANTLYEHRLWVNKDRHLVSNAHWDLTMNLFNLHWRQIWAGTGTSIYQVTWNYIRLAGKFRGRGNI